MKKFKLKIHQNIFGPKLYLFLTDQVEPNIFIKIKLCSVQIFIPLEKILNISRVIVISKSDLIKSKEPSQKMTTNLLTGLFGTAATESIPELHCAIVK